MSKEAILKNLNEIQELVNDDKKFKYKSIVNFNCEHIKEELEAIEKGKNTDIIDNYMGLKNDNAEPSEALKCLDKLFKDYEELCIDTGSNEHIYQECNLTSPYNTIKRYILKAQEQELHNGGRLPNKEILYLIQCLKQCNDTPLLYVNRTYGNKYIVPQKFLYDLVKENAELKKMLKKN